MYLGEGCGVQEMGVQKGVWTGIGVQAEGYGWGCVDSHTPPAHNPHPEMATKAGGTHPTAMHS